MLVVEASLALLIPSHGSLLYPLPRGGVDRDIAPFSTGGFPKGHYTCTCTNGSAAGPCLPAQSCLWFNQGCTIGCPCSGNGVSTTALLRCHTPCIVLPPSLCMRVSLFRRATLHNTVDARRQ